MNIIEFINKYIFGPAVPVLLVGAGIYFSVLLGFFYLKHPIKMVKSMLEKKEKDGISPFRAITVALAGTLGVGNIVGVASAITLGGPGAIFWMWISALAAMVLKYSEIVLAVKYRKTEKLDGKSRNYGGAMYYIREGLGNGKAAVFVAGFFAVLCIINSFTMGSVIQISAAADIFDGILGVPKITTGIVSAILTMFAVCFGAVFLSKITEKLVPVMSVLYMIMSLYVIFCNLGAMPSVFSKIVCGAFTPNSALGGVAGFLINNSLRYGAMRGVLSNEAGCGTSPMAYAASNEKSPAKQGFWGIFEVFVDTVVLCSMTAFVIIISYDELAPIGLDGVMLTVRAYEKSLGSFAGYIMCAAVFLFAYATVICWAEYGMECVNYFFRSKAASTAFLCVYCVSVALGAVGTPEIVWGIADITLGAMTVINTCTVCYMSSEVKEETDKFFLPKG